MLNNAANTVLRRFNGTCILMPNCHFARTGIRGGKRTSDKSCAQHRSPKEIDGLTNMPKADGVAARDRI